MTRSVDGTVHAELAAGGASWRLWSCGRKAGASSAMEAKKGSKRRKGSKRKLHVLLYNICGSLSPKTAEDILTTSRALNIRRLLPGSKKQDRDGKP